MKQAFLSLFALLAILALSAQSALCQDTAPAPEFEHREIRKSGKIRGHNTILG